MKKFLPIVIFILGIAVAGSVAAFTLLRGGGGSVAVEDEKVPELPLSQRPFTSLTPMEDGHFLRLRIENAGIVPGAATLDYQLLYQTQDGTQQGVQGTIKEEDLRGSVERELLLGTESSGTFRYDEGVETGSLTLWFRGPGGKLKAKLATDFHLQVDVDELSSADGGFVYALDDPPSGVYFVVMETFGTGPENVESTNFAIFSSDGASHAGKVI